MRVLIVGAGIGGLALACGLRARGIDVQVFERERRVGDTGGYHLHLHKRALDALRLLLPPAALEQLYASAATGRADERVAMRDHRGRLLMRQRRDDVGSLNVDRVTLRHLLATVAGPDLKPGREYVSHRVTGTAVEAVFADGASVRGDLLVGADGVGSRVARQLAGGPTTMPIGVIGIGGVTPVGVLSECSAALYGNESAFAVGPGGTGMYVGFHDPVGDAAVTGARPAMRAPSYIWGAMIVDSPASRALLDLCGADLRDATVRLFGRRGWSGRTLTVVERAGPASVAAFPLHAAVDPDRLAPWPAGTATALGDAVHAVPPTGGQGAATAILDAGALCPELVSAASGGKTLPMAVHDFEQRMRAHARPAVVESMRPVGWITATASRPASTALRAVVPILAAATAAGRSLRPD